MKISDISVRTGERYEFVSITDEVHRAVREAGVEEGVCLISSTHTTAAVTVNEDYDRDVPRDLAAACRAFVGSLDVRFEHAEGNSDSQDRKSTRLNSSHANISYAVFCLKKTVSALVL